MSLVPSGHLLTLGCVRVGGLSKCAPAHLRVRRRSPFPPLFSADHRPGQVSRLKPVEGSIAQLRLPRSYIENKAAVRDGPLDRIVVHAELQGVLKASPNGLAA